MGERRADPLWGQWSRACPTGKSLCAILRIASQAPLRKIFSLNPSGKSRAISSPIPAREEALAIVTNAGPGMRWTRMPLTNGA